MSVAQSLRAWRRYRRTVSELSRMSDHELRDIGIQRGDIAVVARYGAL